MNQNKRPFDFHEESINRHAKRFYRTTCFEDLSNELVYEIFDYLDGCDINKSFSNLNHRFENLLKNSSLPLTINLTSKSEPILEKTCRQVIIPNKHRILSLQLTGYSLIRNFFDHCLLDSSFNRLESVVLNHLSAYKLIAILFSLNTLPRLSSLTIHLEEEYYYNLSEIYRLIFRLPCLTYNKISVLDGDDSDIFIPMHINEKFSPIKTLIINVACTLNEFMSIIAHTPDVEHVTCLRVVETDDINEDKVELNLTKLKYLYIQNCDIGFHLFEVFIKKVSSALEVLRLKTSSFPEYLDGNRWKQLIKKSLPCLRDFHFDYNASIESFDDIKPNHECIQQFSSTYWTQHGWFFSFKDSMDSIEYSIHPYKKMWFDNREYGESIIQPNRMIESLACTSNNCQPVHLTIEGYTSDTWDELSYIDDMKPCFTSVPFTYLSIDCDEIPISLLIEIIRFLPNLTSLKISSLVLTQVDSLSNEDAEMLLLVSISNKTSKLKIEKTNGMEPVYFLMNLCPRVQCLEADCSSVFDLENLIGCISMNNHTRVPYLSCLCLSTSNTNESMLQNLHRIIDFERLFHMDNKIFRDYTIQSVDEKIFLNWKL